jgi:hypothetical protein
LYFFNSLYKQFIEGNEQATLTINVNPLRIILFVIEKVILVQQDRRSVIVIMIMLIIMHGSDNK